MILGENAKKTIKIMNDTTNFLLNFGGRTQKFIERENHRFDYYDIMEIVSKIRTLNKNQPKIF